MKTIFSCPLCSSNLTINANLLRCFNGHQFPVIDEISYFLPLHQEQSYTTEQIGKLKSTIDPSRYNHYINLKRMRNIFEPYALFQPFNESFQSLLGFIEVLKKKLKPGDMILDTWCRTGFSGDFLAGLFPEQTVVSIWEGNNSVLGYQGFHHFFSAAQKHKNHILLFHDCNKPLPFKDNTFDFIYGYDSLHRYSGIVDECIRIAKKDAIINFAHVHLENSEPKPYFDRGGTIRHGNVYQLEFDEIFKDDQTKSYILSETDVYLNSESKSLISDPNTSHYNGFIWLSSLQWAHISQWKFNIQPGSCILTNPLMKLDAQGRLSLNLNDVHAQHIFERHPILLSQYTEIIKKYQNRDLACFFTSMINSASSIYHHRFTEQDLISLTQDKIIFPAVLSKAMIQAQAMHLNIEHNKMSINKKISRGDNVLADISVSRKVVEQECK
tara:strand:- start:3967 stop:5286 length:1320 start_codon:yes stop_codon:yes gene_type:complete